MRPVGHDSIALVYFPGCEFTCLEEVKELPFRPVVQESFDCLETQVHSLLDREALPDPRYDHGGAVVGRQTLKFGVLRNKHHLLRGQSAPYLCIREPASAKDDDVLHIVACRPKPVVEREGEVLVEQDLHETS